MTKVFVTRHIPEVGLAMLRKRKDLHIVVAPQDKAISRRKLLRSVRGADILLSILTDKIDAAVMDAAGSKLKMIANYAVGFDNIALKEAKRRGIVITNTPGPEISETVAEHVIALMFALAHRIVETDAFSRRGNYHGWGPEMLLGCDVYGTTLGIVGGGAIGSAVAKRMHDGFGVTILYTDIRRNKKLEAETGAKFRTLPQLLKQSDFVSLHVPLLPSTHHMIGMRELKLMKPTAFLINTARGPVIDEAALITALTHHVIAGAGIDVYEHEAHIPRGLRKLKNIILTPHTASATHGARNAISIAVAKNILAFIDGKTPPNAIA